MAGRKIICLGVAILVSMVCRAQAQHGGMHQASWHGSHGGSGHINSGFPLFGVGGGYGGFYGGYYGGFAPAFVIGPGGFVPPVGWMGPPLTVGRGPLLPAPPRNLMGADRNVRPANLKRPDPGRSDRLTTLGDRLFRAGNFKRAEERYLQAIRTAPDLAKPRFRLAQIAMMRGQYDVAAARIREAETAQPGWILSAPDIQALYAEPGDFANNIARLETHLQANPDDRDAWLVLGAEWFLSGRTTKAANVFKRLDDPNRKPDGALAAFLEASNQGELKDGKRGAQVEPMQ
jgi:Tetratricopeptide repeat